MTPWNTDPVFFDIETQSRADLKKVGGRLYAFDKSTRIMSFVALLDGVMHIWIPQGVVDPSEFWDKKFEGLTWVLHSGPEFPPVLADATASGRIWIAHNTWGFDQHVWRAKIDCDAPPFGDTLPLAKAAGLGGGLEKMAHKLFGGEKDKGAIVLRRYMGTPDITPPIGALSVIVKYNIADVALLAKAWEQLDVEIEADVLQAHYNINERGIAADDELLSKIVETAHTSVGEAGQRIEKLTDGVLHQGNLRSTKQVNAWLAAHGLRIKDYDGATTLRKQFVDQALANPWMMLEDGSGIEAVKSIPPYVFEVLALRAASLRITGAKADKALIRYHNDRIYDLFSYHQAHTGRWSSSGVQVHNLPRPKKWIDLEKLLDMHTSGEWSRADPRKEEQKAGALKNYEKLVATIPLDKNGKPLGTLDDLLAALLKPVFIPGHGKVFIIGDYNAIECRVLAWIAGEQWLLEAFRTGADPYKEMAAVVFGIKPSEVNDDQRQLGKIMILGFGYGMSAEKFGIFCGLNGIDLGLAGVSAEYCTEVYRSKHSAIAGYYSGENHGRVFRQGGLWNDLDRAAKTAVTDGVTTYAGRCSFSYNGKTLICTLPSGRKLRYHNARIEDRVPGYAIRMGIDKTKATLVYDAPNGGSPSMYGGKWCWYADTKIVTVRGLIPIDSVRPGDRVWDGVEWVRTDGAVYNGIREVGTWLGELVTGDHLITDGRTWKPVMHGDVAFTRRALSWGHDSVRSLSSHLLTVKGQNRNVAAIAGECISHVTVCSCGKLYTAADRAGTDRRGQLTRGMRDMSRLSQTVSCGICGGTVIPGWYHDATIRSIAHTLTTAVVGSQYIRRGKRIGRNSTVTLSHFPDGMISRSTWIARTTTGTTNPVTSVWSRGPSTVKTAVYDLLNCGPRHRYTVMTAAGPVIAHNCENICQAISRDMTATSLVRFDQQDAIDIVMHVHDEDVGETAPTELQEKVERFARLMGEVPGWAAGLPITVEAYAAPRYLKKPPKGWPKAVYSG